VVKGLVHLGLPKTGASTPQAELFNARNEMLANDGILYPGKVTPGQQDLCGAFLKGPTRHATLNFSELGADELVSKSQAFLNKLADEMRDSAPELALISNEGFSNFDPKRLTCCTIGCSVKHLRFQH